MTRLSAIIAGLGIFLTAMAPRADAQLLARSWVSAGGSDANTCTRPAPCATFMGAIAKTQAGGEVDVADAGSYGIVTITKSITINGGNLGTITIPFASYGVSVRAGANDVVVIRNLEINGADLGYRGVSFEGGTQVVLDNVRIHNVLSDAIVISKDFFLPVAPQNLAISNSMIAAGSNANGIRVNEGVATVSHSLIVGNGGAALSANGTGIINAEENILAGNGIAVEAGFGSGSATAAIIRLSNNDVYGNRTGFACGEGTVLSTGNNRKGDNVGGTASTCAPTGAITQQ